jgi:hypothetical protein
MIRRFGFSILVVGGWGLAFAQTPADSRVPGVNLYTETTQGLVYSSAKQFHGKTIAGGFTISEAGRTVVEARTEGVSDPPKAQDAIFNPAGMTALGVGRVMNPAIRVRSFSSLIAPRSVSSGNPRSRWWCYTAISLLRAN